MQRLVDNNVRDPQWLRNVEGTYMRLDIPYIMPKVLKQLQSSKKLKGYLLPHDA